MKTEARAELWRRFDAGSVTAPELDARLQLVDRAAGDDDVRAALDGPVPLRRRLPVRALALGAAAVVVVALVGAGIVVLSGGRGGTGGTTFGGGSSGGGAAPGVMTIIVAPAPGALPPALPNIAPACDALLELRDQQAASGDDPSVQPANPALLSDPAYVPEGYEIGDEYDVVPGNDPDLAMGITAGNPPPVEILGRELDGDLVVRMRSFRYDGVDAASAAGAEGPRQALCDYGGEVFESPEHPALFTVVVTGAPIPPTAFGGFQRGDRRFSVAVEAASGDQADLDAAAALAVEIAAAELAAATTEPPPG